MKPNERRLGDLLVQSNLISPEQLEAAQGKLRGSKADLCRALVESGQISDDKLMEFVADKFSLPKLSLADIEIDPAIVKLLPAAVAHRYVAIPVFRIGSVLTVAMSDPLNLVAVDEIAYHTKLEIKRTIASGPEIDAAISRCYSLADTMGSTVDRIESSQSADSDDQVLHLKDNEEFSSNMPVVDLVNAIIAQAVKSRASDIHLEAGEHAFVVRFRVDGLMKQVAVLESRINQPTISRIKVMSDMDVSEKRLPQDGRFRMNIAGNIVDFRVSTLPTIFGEKMVIRILDKGNLLVEFSEMGFSSANYEKWLEIMSFTQGLILITGPTGSGKTTSLYAILNKLNSPEKSIVTVEDPVEYHFQGITQVQISEKSELTFSNALRSIVRQNPDILMVGEIRDLATAEISIKACLTGHLVLSTLHTSDAPVSAGRLIDMGVEPYLVSTSLAAVLAQRLVRSICKNCMIKTNVNTRLTQDFQRRHQLQELTFYRGEGCTRCHNTGYVSRIAIHELMIVDPRLKDLISAKAAHLDLRRVALQGGMISLLDDGLFKASEGLTTVEEILRVCHDEDAKINCVSENSEEKDAVRI